MKLDKPLKLNSMEYKSVKNITKVIDNIQGVPRRKCFQENYENVTTRVRMLNPYKIFSM